MSKGRRQLSQEELEIREVLSPEKDSSKMKRPSSESAGIVIRSNTGTPASIQVLKNGTVQVHNDNTGRPASPQVHKPSSPVVNKPQNEQASNSMLAKFGLSSLPSLIKDCVVTGIKEGFSVLNTESRTAKRKRPVANPNPPVDDNNNDDEYDDAYDDDLPEVGLDVVRGDTASRLEIFGVDVNESEYEDLSENEEDPDNSYMPVYSNNASVRNPPNKMIMSLMLEQLLLFPLRLLQQMSLILTFLLSPPVLLLTGTQR